MDLPLSDELYQRFRSLLLSRAGLHYPEQRRNDLQHALSQAARAARLPNLTALADLVTDDPLAWEDLISEITIGETYFFRNTAHFHALRQRILPELFAARNHSAYLRLWSAGCATGEEPYSLAMTISELLPDPRWQVSILATDINQRFLQRAREGLYGSWSFRDTPDQIRERYFTPEGPRWRLRPEIRRQVIFSQLNLAEPVYPSPTNGTLALDIIFCRNVTIYFDEATTRQVAQRFFEALAPGGWLVIGHAEPHLSIYQQFETHNLPGAVLYRKPLYIPVFRGGNASTDSWKTPAPPPAPVRPQPRPTPLLPPAPSLPRPSTPPAPAPASLDERRAAARSAANRGEWSNALSLAEQIAADHPLDSRIHFLIGQIHEHADATDAALSAYRRSVYLDPDFVLGFLSMARIWQQSGLAAEASRALRSARRLLERTAPGDVIPEAEGATASELLAYVQQQLATLE
jgi:chemotaxis protein methyltransferase CheR